MASFTVGGLSTGVDYNDLISKIIEVQRQPIKILENKKTTYNDKISSYSELTSKLSSLKSAANSLRTEYNFYSKSIDVSDSTALSATVSNTAAAGNYTVAATQLAKAHKITHNTGLSDKDTTTVLASGGTFSFTINGETKTITASSDLTLEGLAAEINSQTYTGDVELSATVINTGTTASPSYKMILSSNTSGSDYGITINTDNSILDMTDTAAADSDSDSQYRVEVQAAQDATFTVDGMSITRSSNSVSDVITGVTFNLYKENTTSIISVSANTDKIKEQLQGFVSAYNDVVSFIADNSTYNFSTKVSGTLSGEMTVRSIRNSLRSIVSGSASGLPEDFKILAQIGVTSNSKTGQLEIDGTILDSKLSTNLDDVANLFTDTSEGIGIQIYDYIGDINSTIDGSLTVRKQGLENLISDIDDTIRNMEYRLDKSKALMVQRFSALESLVNGYNTTGDFLSRRFSTSA